MTNDLIQYLITEAGELLNDVTTGDANGRRFAEAEELTTLAARLLERREAAVSMMEYREAA